MCPKNGTIFMLRVPGMGLLFLDLAFYIWYMFIWAMLKVPLVWCLAGILQRVVFIF